MRTFYPILIILLFSYSIFSQELPQQIHQLSDKDTSKVSKILKLAYDLQYKKPKTSLKYAKFALKLAQKQNYITGKLNAQLQFINSAFEAKELTKAQKTAKIALKEAKKIENPYYVSMFYYKLAECFGRIGKKKKGINTYLEAVKYLDNEGESAEVLKMKLLNRIGNTTQYRQAGGDIRYWQESINIAKKHGIKNIELGWAYNRIAAMYATSFRKNVTKKNKHKIQKIIPYLDSALQISDKFLRENPKNREALLLKANSMTEKVPFYYKMSRPKLALKYAKKGLEIRLKIGIKDGISNAYYNLANAYNNVSEMDSALFYMHKHLNLLNKNAPSYPDVYEILGHFYQKNKDYQNAYFFLNKAIEALRKRRFQEVEKVAKDLHLKYQDEKKEAKIKSQKSKLKQKQTQNLLLITGIIFVLIFALYLFYANRQRQKKNKILATQKEEIETQAEELQITNEKLKELDSFKQQMTGMIAHDLKNPLNSIIGLSQFEQYSENNLKIINQAGQQMLNMIGNMLDVYKFEEAEIELNREKIDLQKLIQNVEKEISLLAIEKSLKIHQQMNNNYVLNVDIDLVRRVFVNLLSNAIKYSPNGKNIYLKIEELDSEKIKIIIEDEGIGIPEEKQSQIFEKFLQVEARKSGKIRSTGLGLTFCKMVVEAHGCKIGVISEEGKGASFWFTLTTEGLKELNKLNQEIIESCNYSFSENEIQYLLPHLEDLKSIEIFEISHILKILNTVKVQKNKNIHIWVSEIEDSIFTQNEEKYHTLINLK